jgi:hypothetical protein
MVLAGTRVQLVASFVYAAVAVPIGMLTHQLHSPTSFSPTDVLGQLAIVFVFIALPQELFFRGIVQNLVHSYLDYKASVRDFLAPSMARINSSNGMSDSVWFQRSGNSPLSDQNELEQPFEYRTVENNLDRPLLVDSSHKSMRGSAAPTAHSYQKIETCEYNATGSDDELFLHGVDDDALHMVHTNAAALESQDVSWRHVHTLFFHDPTVFFRSIRMPTWHDWFAIWLSSILYTACTINYYQVWSTTATVLILWLGVCCGWLWRHTSNVVMGAVLHTAITFVGIEVLQFG